MSGRERGRDGERGENGVCLMWSRRNVFRGRCGFLYYLFLVSFSELPRHLFLFCHRSRHSHQIVGCAGIFVFLSPSFSNLSRDMLKTIETNFDSRANKHSTSPLHDNASESSLA